MSNYPERPIRRGRPKSTHSGSKKGRSWLEQNVSTQRKLPEEAHIDLKLCVAGHSNPTLKRFLAQHRNVRIPVGRRRKAGPRPFEV